MERQVASVLAQKDATPQGVNFKERHLALRPLGLPEGKESKEGAPGASKNTGDFARPNVILA